MSDYHSQQQRVSGPMPKWATDPKKAAMMLEARLHSAFPYPHSLHSTLLMPCTPAPHPPLLCSSQGSRSSPHKRSSEAEASCASCVKLGSSGSTS